MPDPREGATELGWRLEVDDDAGEVSLEHGNSGSSYVLNSGGEVGVPGNGTVGAALRDLRATLASAADSDATGASTATGTPAARTSSGGPLEPSSEGPLEPSSDGTTGPIDIESATSITVEAPVVEVSGVEPVEVSSVGGVDVSGGGPPAMRLELPGGTRYPVAPVEGDGPVSEFYGFDTANRNAAALPEGLMVEDATVTFLYRNRGTGDRSLVFVHDVPTSDAGGAAVVTVGGAAGAAWLVQDDPEEVSPPQDRYETTDGAVGESESAAWEWNPDRTDGGALGPLGATLDIDITHGASGTVRDETKERSGLDRWLFVDGRNPEEPIEIARFGGETSADVTARLFTAD